MRRKARYECLKSRIEKARQGQPVEAFTDLQCYNVMNKSIFVEGLQNAGLKLVPRPFSGGNDTDQVVIAVQSQDDAHQIVKAFDGCRMEGRTMHFSIMNAGTQRGNPSGRLPKVEYIRQCVLNAFHGRAIKKEDLAQENSEFAAALQEVCRKIKASKAATKRDKAKKDLTKVEEKAVAMEMSDPESDESEGLGEERHKQKAGEERGEMRDDSFRPENSSTQQMEIGGTQSDLRGERSQIQDTACVGERSHGSTVITSTRSSSPDDMLSALLASLDEGKDAAKGFDTICNLL